MLIPYLELARNLKISSGSTVFISSDISRLAFEALENNIDFNVNEFIDIIQDKIGNEGTLLFPVYNWDFCHGIPFNYNKTVGKTGLLGNAALKREDFKRTKNALYSFAVWGKDKDYLC